MRIDVKYLLRCWTTTDAATCMPPVVAYTRWVYMKHKPARSASGFLLRLIDTAPFTIAQVLTDNGKEFTDCLRATGQRQLTGTQFGSVPTHTSNIA